MSGRIGVVLALLGFMAPEAMAAPRVRVVAPPSAVGDGQTSVAVTVRLIKARKGKTLANVELVSSAGVVGTSSVVPNGVTFRFVPPRVAAPMRVKLSVTALIGRSRVRARAAIRVEVPPASKRRIQSDGPWQLEGPHHMVLGRDTEALIRLRKPMGRQPRLVASAGSIGPVRSSGRYWEATYRVPSTAYPQIAIVAAISPDDERLEWIVIPLYGVGSLALRSEPRASVLVRVCDIDYGPVRTNARGRAKLSIAAPPGLAYARTVATDALGNARRGRLALGPPPFNRILALCPRGGSNAQVIITDELGRPAPKAKVAATVSPGAIAVSRMLRPGLRQLVYKAAADARAGQRLQLEVALPGQPMSKSVCSAAIPAERPTKARVVLDRRVFAAGGKPITVTVHPEYAGNLPRLRVPLELRAEVGEVVGVRVAKGVVTASWKPGNRLDGTVAAIRVYDRGVSLGATEVSLRAGPVAKLVVSAARRRLLADGSSRTSITVVASDRFGNPVSGATLTGRAHGSVGAFSPRGNGRYRASYTSPATYRGVERIRVVHEGTGVTGSLRMSLVAQRPQRSLAVKLGYLSNSGKVSSPLAQVDFSMRAPRLPRVWLGLEAGLYHSSRSLDVGMNTVETIVTGVPLVARGGFVFARDPLAVYLGGGLGLFLGRAGAESESTGPATARQIEPAMSAVLGADLRVGPGRAVVEVGYLYIPVDTGTVAGNIGGAHGTAGYRYGF